ncbi:unnamed protein product [Amoebophrya sp. A120]|nr:unnamed protein product [Amoebophrya sp. A120]|eukprot:GSA120T00001747001.1
MRALQVKHVAEKLRRDHLALLENEGALPFPNKTADAKVASRGILDDITPRHGRDNLTTLAALGWDAENKHVDEDKDLHDDAAAAGIHFWDRATSLLPLTADVGLRLARIQRQCLRANWHDSSNNRSEVESRTTSRRGASTTATKSVPALGQAVDRAFATATAGSTTLYPLLQEQLPEELHSGSIFTKTRSTSYYPTAKDTPSPVRVNKLLGATTKNSVDVLPLPSGARPVLAQLQKNNEELLVAELANVVAQISLQFGNCLQDCERECVERGSLLRKLLRTFSELFANLVRERKQEEELHLEKQAELQNELTDITKFIEVQEAKNPIEKIQFVLKGKLQDRVDRKHAEIAEVKAKRTQIENATADLEYGLELLLPHFASYMDFGEEVFNTEQFPDSSDEDDGEDDRSDDENSSAKNSSGHGSRNSDTSESSAEKRTVKATGKTKGAEVDPDTGGETRSVTSARGTSSVTFSRSSIARGRNRPSGNLKNKASAPTSAGGGASSPNNGSFFPPPGRVSTGRRTATNVSVQQIRQSTLKRQDTANLTLSTAAQVNTGTSRKPSVPPRRGDRRTESSLDETSQYINRAEHQIAIALANDIVRISECWARRLHGRKSRSLVHGDPTCSRSTTAKAAKTSKATLQDRIEKYLRRKMKASRSTAITAALVAANKLDAETTRKNRQLSESKEPSCKSTANVLIQEESEDQNAEALVLGDNTASLPDITDVCAAAPGNRESGKAEEEVSDLHSSAGGRDLDFRNSRTSHGESRDSKASGIIDESSLKDNRNSRASASSLESELEDLLG